MPEDSKEITPECPVAYSLQQEDGGLQAEGQAKARLATSGLTLFPESGEALVVTYRNILDFSVLDLLKFNTEADYDNQKWKKEA